MFFQKKQKARSFDRETLRPVIRASICTGERTAGFQDRRSGKFQDIMLVRSEGDLQAFCRMYGISPEEVTTIY